MTKNDRPVNVINKMVSEMVTVQDQARREGSAKGVLVPPPSPTDLKGSNIWLTDDVKRNELLLQFFYFNSRSLHV